MEAASHPSLPFELEALTQARRYQAWIADAVRPWLGRRILEVGSGIGTMSQWLPREERLILTEADPTLYDRLRAAVMTWPNAGDKVRVDRFALTADTAGAYADENLDTIVSFNVLEHIENDREALRTLCELLRRSRAGGPKRLVTLVPAHAWAYGSIDRTFGHFRRYSAGQFKALARDLAPEAGVQTSYFNAFGLAAWILQGRILKAKSFGKKSVQAFELLSPVLRPIDDLLHGALRLPLGQSLIAVLEWR